MQVLEYIKLQPRSQFCNCFCSTSRSVISHLSEKVFMHYIDKTMPNTILNVGTLSWKPCTQIIILQWSKNCREMIQCCGIKNITQTYIFKPNSTEIFCDILLMMMHICVGYVCRTTSQWCENIQTLSYWCPIFFPCLALVRGQPQTACGGIRRYCRCHIDALQGPGGHVSVNIHYQNP